MKLGLLLAALTLPLPAALQAQKDVTVTERYGTETIEQRRHAA